MAKYINEFSELREYRELAERKNQLVTEAAHIDMDRMRGWCDYDLEVLRHDAYVAIEKYYEAIDDRLDKKTKAFYEKLDFADTHKPKKRFWNIFR